MKQNNYWNELKMYGCYDVIDLRPLKRQDSFQEVSLFRVSGFRECCTVILGEIPLCFELEQKEHEHFHLIYHITFKYNEWRLTSARRR